jgi:hypothetical protein
VNQNIAVSRTTHFFAHSIKANQNGMANCDNRRAFRAFLIISMHLLYDYGY